MSLRVNTNVAALNAYQNLSANQSKLEDAFQQLSSGSRINTAADDSSGLAISQGLTSQINGLTQAVSNTQDATNVAQIADGALSTTQSVLQRMRTLTIQASNTGTQDTASLAAIQSEMTSLSGQLDNISSQTKFGSKSLLDGTYNGTFQIGANAGETATLAITSSAGGSVGFSSANLAVGSVDVTTSAGAASALTAINTALTTVSTARATIGATQNKLSYTTTNLQTTITNVTSARSNLTDADMATEVTAMTQQQVLVSAATSVLSQANSAPQTVLKLLQG